MDNNKEPILRTLRNIGTDIISFLSKKYNVPRYLVKQYVFVYAYSGSIISNPDSLKFVEPDTDYQKLINDYIEYTKECSKLTMQELLAQRSKYEHSLSAVAVKKEDVDRFHESIWRINETLKELFDDGQVIQDTIEI